MLAAQGIEARQCRDIDELADILRHHSPGIILLNAVNRDDDPLYTDRPGSLGLSSLGPPRWRRVRLADLHRRRHM